MIQLLRMIRPSPLRSTLIPIPAIRPRPYIQSQIFLYKSPIIIKQPANRFRNTNLTE